MTRLLHRLGLLVVAAVLLVGSYVGARPLFAAAAADEPGLFGKKKPPAADEMEEEAPAGEEEAAPDNSEAEEEPEDDGAGKGIESGLGKLKGSKDWGDAATEKRAKKKPGKVAEGVDPKRVEELLDAMEGMYEKRIDSTDWVSRALATTSLARSPRATMLERMFTILEGDKHPVVRLLAWQAILARADELDASAHARWLKATYPMAAKGWFNGPLRATLLNVMATAPATPTARKIYGALFDTANAWEPQDMATLDALGGCLKAWHDPAVAEALVKRLTDPNACVRAEYVLFAAGSTATPARELVGPTAFDPLNKDRRHPGSTQLWAGAQQSHVGWVKQVRKEWKKTEGTIGGEPWRDLDPKYVPAPIDLSDIDPDDPAWREDLELGRVNLTDFEVVFVVDATGSMGEVIDWLKRDVGKMLAAFSIISTKPRLGVTFYRDNNAGFAAKTFPLTNKAGPLLQQMAAITADGGGDIPEAVLAGLGSAIKDNRWSSKGKSDSRVIVLVGDAPPHAKDIPNCIKVASLMSRDGWRFHTVKVKTNDGPQSDLGSFDEIAEAGRGECISVEFPPITRTRFVDENQKEIPIKTMARPEAQLIVASRPPADHPGEEILATVLGNAMNPQYHDRMQPMLRTLLAFAEQRPEPETRLAFPANTPPLQLGKLKRQ